MIFEKTLEEEYREGLLEEEPVEKEGKEQRHLSKPEVARLCTLIIGVSLIIAGVTGLAAALVRHISTTSSYADAEKSYFSELPASARSAPSTLKDSGIFSEDIVTVGSPEGATPWYEYAFADVAAMQADYPCVVGWLYFENGDISYPIVFSGDNESYLRTNYKGVGATSGSIFVDGASSPDFGDSFTIVYGHNMRDLTMFGKLKYFKQKKGYAAEAGHFQIFVPGAVYRYAVFAYGDVPADSTLYNEGALGSKSMSPAVPLGIIASSSMVSSNYSYRAGDRILTLSTCTTSSDERFAVSAVRVDEHRY